MYILDSYYSNIAVDSGNILKIKRYGHMIRLFYMQFILILSHS